MLTRTEILLEKNSLIEEAELFAQEMQNSGEWSNDYAQNWLTAKITEIEEKAEEYLREWIANGRPN
jgi:hypothetical protein